MHNNGVAGNIEMTYLMVLYIIINLTKSLDKIAAGIGRSL